MDKDNVEKVQKRYAQMQRQKELRVPIWREISRFIAPNRGNFNDKTPDVVARQDLIDATPLLALETLQSGIQGGMTTPSRAWFKLQVADPDIAANPSVMRWMDDVKNRISTVLSRSNIYDCLHNIYGEISAFGIGALFIEDDRDSVVNGKMVTTGDYCVAFDSRDKPNTFGRQLWLSATQIVDKFGLDNVSNDVKQAIEKGAPETWFKVIQFICEDNDHETRFPYMSVYWQDNCKNALSVGGYEEFPVLIPRWEVHGNDFYGYGPGWDALGESKTLQAMRKDYLTAQQALISPPVFGSSALRKNRVDLFPGGITYTDEDASLKPVYQVNPDISGQYLAINDCRENIRKIFFNDLFLMLAAADSKTMTAFEARIRQLEKMNMLGPVVERVIHEILDPLICRTFAVMDRRGLFSPPPDELLGREIKIEYISTLVLAQKAVELSEINNLLGVVGGLAQLQPDIIDKLNGGIIIDKYVQMSNVPASIIRSDAEVAEIRRMRDEVRQQEQQMAAVQQMAAAAKQGAGAVKDLSSVISG